MAHDPSADALANKLRKLKHVVVSISDEVRQQNSLLGSLDVAFKNSQSLMNVAKRKIGDVVSTGGARLILYLFVFSAFVLFGIYYLVR